jgi:hypothetical protein
MQQFYAETCIPHHLASAARYGVHIVGKTNFTIPIDRAPAYKKHTHPKCMEMAQKATKVLNVAAPRYL